MKNKSVFRGVDTSAKAFASQRKEFYEEAIATMQLIRATLCLAAVLMILGILWGFSTLAQRPYGWVLVVLGVLWVLGILIQAARNEESVK